MRKDDLVVGAAYRLASEQGDICPAVYEGPGHALGYGAFRCDIHPDAHAQCGEHVVMYARYELVRPIVLH